jgi:hypothetical protein
MYNCIVTIVLALRPIPPRTASADTRAIYVTSGQTRAAGHVAPVSVPAEVTSARVAQPVPVPATVDTVSTGSGAVPIPPSEHAPGLPDGIASTFKLGTSGHARSTLQVTVCAPPSLNAEGVVLLVTHGGVRVAALDTVLAMVDTVVIVCEHVRTTSTDAARAVLVTATSPLSSHTPTIVA